MKQNENSPSQFGRLMGIISRFAMIFFKRKMKNHELNGHQMGILMFLSNNEGISQDEIVSHVFLNKGTVGRHLQSLEKKSMITRKISSEDHRYHQVYLTKKAKNLLPLFLETANEWQNIMLQGLSIEEIKLLENIIRKVTLNIMEEFNVSEKCKEIL